MKRYFTRRYWRQCRTRLRAVRALFTSDFFVVLTARNSNHQKIDMNLNVDYRSFWNMVRTVDGTMFQRQADARIMRQVEEALKNNNKAL